jgi:hypothetical protein
VFIAIETANSRSVKLLKHLVPAGYFVAPRECITCHEFLPKYRFTLGRWKGPDNARVCRHCTH